MNEFIVISGCSGGGKSTLLNALKSEGYNVIQEAGRRVYQAEVKGRGEALPSKNMPLFLECAIALATQDFQDAVLMDGPVFFDRSLVDLILAYEHFTGRSKFKDRLTTMRYGPKVYFAPPWAEIYVTDAERQHSLKAAISEYKRLEIGYPKLGYTLKILPKTSVTDRVKFITNSL